ncbi:hypothetical protein XANCAGTX0491_008173 [Xanthoria calcicola]
MERTGKGTVQRTDTLRLYKDEIIKLFKTPEIPKIDPRQVVPPEIDQGSTLRKVLNELVSTSVEHDGEIDDQTDFFDLGLDSLQALALSKKINAHLIQKSPIPLTVTPNTIYTHSNVDGLTAVLEPTHSSSPAKENDEEKMQQIFSRCSSSLPQASGGRTRRKGQAVVVLLTGSTGSLGSYILDALIQDPRIDKIYCCNRGYDAQTKQTKSSQATGLSFDWQKVKFIHYDLGKPRLGLVDSDPSYDALSQEVTHVIHNAWDVNFKRSLDSFVNVHLCGVSELIHFCTGAQPAAHFTFISSESAVLGGSAGSIAKEEIIHDWSRAQNMGYAQSKLIAEGIIEQANLPGSTIIRVGQIAGPTDGKGVWDRQEWFPSLINSSAHMRKLPDTLPMKKDVDWVPVDIVGKAVVELLFPPPPPPDHKEAQDGANTDHRVVPSEPPIITAKEPNPATPTYDSTPATLPIPKPPTSLPPASHPASPCSPPDPPTQPPTIYHISSPHPLAFSSLIPAIQSACSTQLEIVSLPHWLAELETAIEKGEAGEEMAARSLVEFLRGSEGEGGGGRLDITRARARSGTLAALEGVKGEWVGGWMRGWVV